jgi:SAM-dependent methyltransferase
MKKDFWNRQYKRPTHLALSDEPSEDLVKFTRWLERYEGRKHLNVTALALDLGCGNGRNLIYLAQNFNMRGVGYDTSSEAIAQAKKLGTDMPLEFLVRSIAEPLPLADNSVTLALDMMSSHALPRADRERLRSETLRMLRPNGWLFFKSFLLEDDQNAERMLREHPGPEPDTYIHPDIGVPEYVWTETSLREFFEPYFTIHKIEKSYKHVTRAGSPWKRRTVSAYLEKHAL